MRPCLDCLAGTFRLSRRQILSTRFTEQSSAHWEDRRDVAFDRGWIVNDTRGLSTRDIEDAFTDETGRRDLTEHAVAHLFIDRIAERLQKSSYSAHSFSVISLTATCDRSRLRPGQRREAALAAWGIGEDGRKSFLGLMAGSKEDVETVRAFFQDLRARGLGDPLLVVSDGAPGIIPAIDECFPRSARQPRTTNLLERLFVEERRRLKIIPNGSAKSRCSSSCSARSSGLRFTEFELRQIAAGRRISEYAARCSKQRCCGTTRSL